MAKAGNRSMLFDPMGVRINHDAWDALRMSMPDKYVISEFDNGKVRVQLRATDSLSRMENIPSNFWPMFKVEIVNIVTTDSEGRPLPIPSERIDPDSRTFPTRSAAVDFYEKFLAKYTESHFDEVSGELREVGNTLTPPDPDVPVISETSPAAGEFGSW